MKDYYNFYIGVSKISGTKHAGYTPYGFTLNEGDEVSLVSGERFKIVGVANFNCMDGAIATMLTSSFGMLDKPVRVYRATEITWEDENVDG